MLYEVITSTAVVDTADITFTVVPEMTTLGEKTVVVAYSKTKQGAYTQAVSTFYKLEVTNPVASLAVTTFVITSYSIHYTKLYDGTDSAVTTDIISKFIIKNRKEQL